jgi:hypothetical protein
MHRHAAIGPIRPPTNKRWSEAWVTVVRMPSAKLEPGPQYP